VPCPADTAIVAAPDVAPPDCVMNRALLCVLQPGELRRDRLLLLRLAGEHGQRLRRRLEQVDLVPQVDRQLIREDVRGGCGTRGGCHTYSPVFRYLKLNCCHGYFR
jgi:hypothetical protein